MTANKAHILGLCWALSVGPSCSSSALPEVDAAVARDAVVHAPSDDVVLVGSFSIASDAKDLSGLHDVLEDGTPHDQLGAFGSAIAWTGSGEHYVCVVDRGPSNGDVTFHCRCEAFDVHVDPKSTPPVKATLTATTLFTDESGHALVGRSRAFDLADPAKSLRFDPEGLRVSKSGTLFVSDEYGPSICEFDRNGKRLRSLKVPPEFAIAHPGTGKEESIAGNVRGRVSNHGFEGLALSPDGSKIYALLQGPMIQDHGRDGRVSRMLEVDLATQATRQFACVLEQRGLNFNELLAIDDHRFLAIERDSEGGSKARSKTIVELDIAGASDVSKIEAFPEGGVPDDVHAVKKQPFIDMLDPRFHLAGAEFPEKIEGLAFGPDLADGRHVLVVTSDNDFKKGQPSWFWAFAIEPRALPGFVPQKFETKR